MSNIWVAYRLPMKTKVCVRYFVHFDIEFQSQYTFLQTCLFTCFLQHKLDTRSRFQHNFQSSWKRKLIYTQLRCKRLNNNVIFFQFTKKYRTWCMYCFSLKWKNRETKNMLKLYWLWCYFGNGNNWNSIWKTWSMLVIDMRCISETYSPR